MDKVLLGFDSPAPRTHTGKQQQQTTFEKKEIYTQEPQENACFLVEKLKWVEHEETLFPEASLKVSTNGQGLTKTKAFLYRLWST